ncbi:permease prefix domain 1-containing protein [Anaerocolumna sp. MB42-C2]|uniref:permease prefix domain 1-containing protein n=1 Tax=Anaerocolumna sp. MB42-C2 TaxID=3070997 RepID=UPI0027DF80F9|nr:permease prefix domain 1-containing protein [Anaerocolumna sp. MB42-C2]WMJ87380.1 permease prefix domain 1-containing protein [Anaerocolumna sp. MB42-C2]
MYDLNKMKHTNEAQNYNVKELKTYVDHLFKKHKNSSKTADLKEEIFSNLEAKWLDYMNQGMSEKEALLKVKSSITSIDGLVEESKLFYAGRFRLERLQIILMYLIIAWILSTPVMIFHRFSLLNTLLFLAVIITCIYYAIQNKQAKNNDIVSALPVESYLKWKKAIWLLWGVFILVNIFLITGINFASNIWFFRPIKIAGPYQFAKLAIQYYIPFITILIPIAISHIYKVLLKNGTGDQYED